VIIVATQNTTQEISGIIGVGIPLNADSAHAGVDVNASTVNTTESLETQGNPYGGRNWQITDKQTQTLAGGKLDAGQDINVIAGMSAELGYQVGLLASPTSALPERANNANSGNITLSGAQLSAGTPDSKEVGQVNLLAQGDIDIGTVEVVNTSDTFKFDKSSNIGGNKTTTQRTVTETHTQVGTSVSADQINVAAGGNLNMTGSAVSAAGDARLVATGNVTIQAATNTETRYTEDSKRSSGITSSGGLSLHVGTSSQKSQAWLDATSQSQGMSLVGSEFGSVNVTAGKDNKISGTILGTTSAGEIAAAKVAKGTANAQEIQAAQEWQARLQDATNKDTSLLSNPRDINLSGQSVSVTSGQDTLDQRTKFEARQSGVTVVSGPSVRNSFFAEFQPLFFQRSASRSWFLMGLLHLLVLRCACFLSKFRHSRRLPPCPVRTVRLDLI
jgi:hypothetical protein